MKKYICPQAEEFEIFGRSDILFQSTEEEQKEEPIIEEEEQNL